MRRGRPEFRIIYVTRLTRNDKIQQKQGSILYFFYFPFSFCELVDPNYLTRPTRILKNRIYQQKTKPVLFLVLWDKPDPWPEFRIIYVTRPTRIGRIQQKQGSNFLFIFLFFSTSFCELVDPNYLTRPTRIIKNRIFQQEKTRSALFVVLWDRPDPNSESYTSRGQLELMKYSKNKVLIFYFFHFFNTILWVGRPELPDEADPNYQKSDFSAKKRVVSYFWYCETGPTRIQNHIRDDADTNCWNAAKTRF